MCVRFTVLGPLLSSYFPRLINSVVPHFRILAHFACSVLTGALGNSLTRRPLSSSVKGAELKSCGCFGTGGLDLGGSD